MRPVLKTAAASRSFRLTGFDPLAHRQDGARRVADLPSGATAELTLDPALQAQPENAH